MTVQRDSNSWRYGDTYAGPITLRRVSLDRGGYTKGGRYFGVGAPVFEYEADGGTGGEFFDGYVRAADRESAKAKLRAMFPHATGLGGPRRLKQNARKAPPGAWKKYALPDEREFSLPGGMSGYALHDPTDTDVGDQSFVLRVPLDRWDVDDVAVLAAAEAHLGPLGRAQVLKRLPADNEATVLVHERFVPTRHGARRTRPAAPRRPKPNARRAPPGAWKKYARPGQREFGLPGGLSGYAVHDPADTDVGDQSFVLRVPLDRWDVDDVAVLAAAEAHLGPLGRAQVLKRLPADNEATVLVHERFVPTRHGARRTRPAASRHPKRNARPDADPDYAAEYSRGWNKGARDMGGDQAYAAELADRIFDGTAGNLDLFGGYDRMPGPAFRRGWKDAVFEVANHGQAASRR